MASRRSQASSLLNITPTLRSSYVFLFSARRGDFIKWFLTCLEIVVRSITWEDHLWFLNKFNWWTLTPSFSTSREDGFLFSYVHQPDPWWLMLHEAHAFYAPWGWCSLIASRRIPSRPLLPHCIISFSRCCTSRCVCLPCEVLLLPNKV